MLKTHGKRMKEINKGKGMERHTMFVKTQQSKMSVFPKLAYGLHTIPVKTPVKCFDDRDRQHYSKTGVEGRYFPFWWDFGGGEKVKGGRWLGKGVRKYLAELGSRSPRLSPEEARLCLLVSRKGQTGPSSWPQVPAGEALPHAQTDLIINR